MVVEESNDRRRTPAGVSGCPVAIPDLFTLSVTATALVVGKDSIGRSAVMVDVDGTVDITGTLGVVIVGTVTFSSIIVLTRLVPSVAWSIGENPTFPIIGGPNCGGLLECKREGFTETSME